MYHLFRVNVSSPPDRKHVVAEVIFDNVQWAEVNQEGKELLAEFYPRPDGRPWEIPLAAALGALQEARSRLVETAA